MRWWVRKKEKKEPDLLADRQLQSQTDRQTDRQADRWTDKQTEIRECQHTHKKFNANKLIDGCQDGEKKKKKLIDGLILLVSNNPVFKL